VGGRSHDVGVLAGLGWTPAATSPEKCACPPSAARPPNRAMARIRGKSIMRDSAAAGHDQLRPVLVRQAAPARVVDGFVLAAHAVRDHVVGLAGEVQVVAWVSGRRGRGSCPAWCRRAGRPGHVAAMLAWAPGVRLHVALWPETTSWRAPRGQGLHHIHVVATAIGAAWPG